MDEGLKRRLVGAAVLAALAVIFVPMLIGGEPVVEPTIRDIPAAPASRPFDASALGDRIVLPEPPSADAPPPFEPILDQPVVTVHLGVDQASRPDPQVLPNTVTPIQFKEPAAAPVSPIQPSPSARLASAKPDQDTPAASSQPNLAAWAVKVGSFSKPENARKLALKLRESGFQTPDPTRVEIRGKTLYRVLVGPFIDRKRAEQLLPKVNAVSGTKGMLTRF